MKSFIACAKTCALILVIGFFAIQGFALIWAAAFFGDMPSIAAYSILWLDYLATAFIAIMAGTFGPHFDRQHPIVTSAAAAGLVALLNGSVGAGLRDSPAKTVAWTLATIGLAAAIAWWRSRRAPPLPPPEIAVPETGKE
jgi:uncharacterized membrane protein